MSDLRARIRALRGERVTDPHDESVEAESARDGPAGDGPARDGPARDGAAADDRYAGAATQLGADVVIAEDEGRVLRSVRTWARDARHGRAPLGGAAIDPRLRRWAARSSQGGSDRDGPVVYLDTETTGLAGGTGTFVFLVGLGRHQAGGFEVEQFMLPGPEHEPAYLRSVHERLSGASVLVSYNGASFDLPLLRTRFALHGFDDPTAGVPHLDLLPLARRLWRDRLPNCRLGTIEREVLHASRSHADVPGAEVPMRYLAFLRSRDAAGLRGVLEHNRIDIVALTALRSWLEARFEPGGSDDAGEAYGLARWLDDAGEPQAALDHLLAADGDDVEIAWAAARLLRRAGRTEEAVERWRRLATAGDARGWIALAKHLEHRRGDPAAALEAAIAARGLGGASHDDLDRRIDRLRRRVARQND